MPPSPEHWDALGITHWEKWNGENPAETPCTPHPPPAALGRAGAPARHGHRGHGLVLVPVCSWCDSIWLHLLAAGLGGTECGSWRARVTQRGAAGQQLIPPGCAGLPSCCRAGTGTVSSERFPSRGLRIMHLEQHSLIQVCDLSENQIPVISPAIWPPRTRGRPGGREARAGAP